MVDRAETICARLNARLATTSPARLDDQEIARAAGPNAALERAALAELERLTPSVSLAPDWRQMLGYRRTLAGELVELGRDARSKDSRGIQAVAKAKELTHRELFELATRDGFKHCAQTGIASRALPAGHAPQVAAGPVTTRISSAKLAREFEKLLKHEHEHKRSSAGAHP